MSAPAPPVPPVPPARGVGRARDPRLKRQLRVVMVATVVIEAGVALTLLFARHRPGEEGRLAKGAASVSPVTYVYSVLQGAQVIGIASSAVDTTHDGITVTDIVHARGVVYGEMQMIDAMSKAYLDRSFALDSFSLSLGGDQGPFNLHGVPAARSGVLVPTLGPMAFLLGKTPRAGRAESYWMYNPLSQRVERVILRIEAESTLNVPDGDRFDTASKQWVPARTATIHAWSVTTPTHSVQAWVDEKGRVISAMEPGGLAIARSTAQLARQAAGLDAQ